MRRRDFIKVVAGSAAAWPLRARAQQQKGPVRLGLLPIGSPSNAYDRSLVEAFQQGLRLGTIYAFPVAAREGSLIAYGPDYLQMYRRAPLYVDRILKGTKPADLPVELPSKVQFLINLQTAKTLGIEVPLSLLIRADELLG